MDVKHRDFRDAPSNPTNEDDVIAPPQKRSRNIFGGCWMMTTPMEITMTARMVLPVTMATVATATTTSSHLANTTKNWWPNVHEKKKDNNQP